MRLERLELHDVRGVRHGAIDFTTQPGGGSVTGIYGPSGSGKTSVIEAMRILRLLLSGARLRDEPAAAFIRKGGSQATLNATFCMPSGSVLYSVTLDDSQYGPHVVHETVTLKQSGDGRTRRRVLADCAIRRDDPSTPPKPTFRPAIPWRSLDSLRHASGAFRLEAMLASDQNRSVLFSPGFAAHLETARDALERMGDGMPASKRNALNDILLPLIDVTSRLSAFAADDMLVVTATGNGAIHFGHAPVVRGETIDMLDADRPRLLPVEIRPSIERMAEQVNAALPSIIPGMSLRAEMESDVMDDGSDGIRVTFRTVRNGMEIPFRGESGGVRRIVGILPPLIRMFADPDACVVVDGLDSDMFEILFGDLSQTLAERGRGQLVFTAHDLRALETLPPDSIVFATSDPERRFIGIDGVRGDVNLRDAYIRSVNMGDGDIGPGERVPRSRMAVALSRAGKVPSGEGTTEGTADGDRVTVRHPSHGTGGGE